jgi:4-hydroxy-tetrahydrodipicolinate synthase
LPDTSLQGVIAAIATPLAGAAPDTAKFLALAQNLLATGCDGLNVLGTTGEATSFTTEQRLRLMAEIGKSSLSLSRLMVGTGAASVGDAVTLTRAAAENGFAGALILPPFYYKGVSDEGVVGYFAAIVEATRDRAIPLYLYNFPAMTGIPYTLDLVRRLQSEFGTRIAGLKDSSGDLAYARSMATLDIDVFPSNEAVLLEARAGSFAGCISATANLNASYCAAAYRQGDAAALETAVRIRKLFDGKQLVSGVKALLSHIHRDESLRAVMPPLMAWPDTERSALIENYEPLIRG